MNLHQQFLTENNCYKAGKKITVKGLMLHSTGANNTKLSRYVGPDDGLLGTPSSNNWNQPLPGGREVCTHGFIGKLKDGSIATYQTLPWNHRGWGGGGKSNDTHIHIEICEDDLTDGVYFAAVYKEAVEVFTHLCKQFGLTEKNIICHSEGHKLGIASNHGDVMHWFPKHGKSMDTFRADVKASLGGTVQTPTPAAPVSAPPSIDQLAHDVIDGKYGSGEERKVRLGAVYAEVQARVNEILGAPAVSKPAPQPAPPSIDQLAHEVIDGKHGSGDARRRALGSRYDEVQKRVNELLGAKPSQPKPAEKTISQLADEVMRGVHGSGRDRMRSLGSKYTAVQAEVNRRLR